MVYSRSVISAILAAGAISSVLAVPVPADSSAALSPGSVALRSSLTPTPAIARRGPTGEEQGHVAHEKRANEGKQSKKEKNRERKEEKKAAAKQRKKELEEKSANHFPSDEGSGDLDQTEQQQPKKDEKTGPAVLGEQDAAPTNGLRRRDHDEHHSHHYDFSVLEESIERVDHAKERVHAADDHLYHLLRMKDEGEFVSKHRLRKAKHRLEKAKHRLHVAEEHLQHVEHAFNKGEFDHEHHHHAVLENIVKHKEVGLEVVIAPRVDGNNPIPGNPIAPPPPPPVSRRVLYGDDLD